MSARTASIRTVYVVDTEDSMDVFSLSTRPGTVVLSVMAGSVEVTLNTKEARVLVDALTLSINRADATVPS